jgi:hypothetical protein
MKEYDPMQDFHRQGINFLYKQGVAVVIAIVFLAITLSAIKLMWGKIERMEAAFEAKIELNNQQWAKSLDVARQDWRNCEEKREALAVEVATLRVEIRKLKR